MKTLKGSPLLKVLLSTLLTTSFLGCGSDSDDNNDNSLFNTVVTCEVGQILTESSQCLEQGDCPDGEGWNGQSCEPGTIISYGDLYGTDQVAFSNTLQIISESTFEAFLEGMGLCTNYQYPSQLVSCRTYSNSGYLIMHFYPEDAEYDIAGNVPAYVTIGAGITDPNLDPYGEISVVKNLDMTTYVINDNTGFDVYTRGSFAYGFSSEVSLRTEDGNYLTDENFETRLRYNGVEFARTFVNRH